METIYDYFSSENPEDHWKYIECKNEIAVDLGCGRWEHVEYRDKSWQTTPEFILNRGALKVYAFNSDMNEIQWYINNICPIKPEIIPTCECINSVDSIRNIFLKYSPTVVKCDIEENEKFILELSNEEFCMINFYAIETHNDILYNEFINKFKELNYNIFSVLKWKNSESINVIFAKKNNTKL